MSKLYASQERVTKGDIVILLGVFNPPRCSEGTLFFDWVQKFRSGLTNVRIWALQRLMRKIPRSAILRVPWQQEIDHCANQGNRSYFRKKWISYSIMYHETACKWMGFDDPVNDVNGASLTTMMSYCKKSGRSTLEHMTARVTTTLSSRTRVYEHTRLT